MAETTFSSATARGYTVHAAFVRYDWNGTVAGDTVKFPDALTPSPTNPNRYLQNVTIRRDRRGIVFHVTSNRGSSVLSDNHDLSTAFETGGSLTITIADAEDGTPEHAFVFNMADFNDTEEPYRLDVPPARNAEWDKWANRLSYTAGRMHPATFRFSDEAVGVVLPDAVAPSVTINAVADGDEGTKVTLGAQLGNDGTFDGDVAYKWTVEAGTLDDDTSATPEWARPNVNADTDYDIDLKITVDGDGTNAKDGTTDSRDATQIQATVENVAATLPDAVAPSVAIDAVPNGNEATDVQLSATVTGGNYDGAIAYRWTVDDGALDDATAASPTWTRPGVSSDMDVGIELTVTVRGDGTTRRNGSSATATATATARVLNVAPADTTPPRLSSAVAVGTLLDLTFDEALDESAVPPASAFTLSSAGGATISNVMVSGACCRLVLSQAISGNAPTVAYRRPSNAANRLKDAAGNQVANFTGQAIATVAAAAGDYRPVEGECYGIAVAIAFDATLDIASGKRAADWKLQVNGLAVTVASVALYPHAALLTLASEPPIGSVIEASYTQPSADANKLDAADGEHIPTFERLRCLNGTGSSADPVPLVGLAAERRVRVQYSRMLSPKQTPPATAFRASTTDLPAQENRKTLTASGNYTVPAGVAEVVLELFGGSGGGGSGGSAGDGDMPGAQGFDGNAGSDTTATYKGTTHTGVGAPGGRAGGAGGAKSRILRALATNLPRTAEDNTRKAGTLQVPPNVYSIELIGRSTPGLSEATSVTVNGRAVSFAAPANRNTFGGWPGAVVVSPAEFGPGYSAAYGHREVLAVTPGDALPYVVPAVTASTDSLHYLLAYAARRGAAGIGFNNGAGGGSGGSGANGAGDGGQGGGGGRSAVRRVTLGVTPGDTIAIAIGNGGAGGRQVGNGGAGEDGDPGYVNVIERTPSGTNITAGSVEIVGRNLLISLPSVPSADYFLHFAQPGTTTAQLLGMSERALANFVLKPTRATPAELAKYAPAQDTPLGSFTNSAAGIRNRTPTQHASLDIRYLIEFTRAVVSWRTPRMWTGRGTVSLGGQSYAGNHAIVELPVLASAPYNSQQRGGQLALSGARDKLRANAVEMERSGRVTAIISVVYSVDGGATWTLPGISQHFALTNPRIVGARLTFDLIPLDTAARNRPAIEWSYAGGLQRSTGTTVFGGFELIAVARERLANLRWPNTGDLT